VHGVIGKLSFSEEHLRENFEAFINVIHKARPSGAKGTYIKKCTVASCMSPGIQIAM